MRLAIIWAWAVWTAALAASAPAGPVAGEAPEAAQLADTLPEAHDSALSARERPQHRRRRHLDSLIPTQEERTAWYQQRIALSKDARNVFQVQTYMTKVRGLKSPPPEPIPGRKPRLGICVIGQNARLELESKMKHAVGTLSKEFTVDMVLVLGNDTVVHFVNAATDLGIQASWKVDQITQLFRSAVRYASSTGNVAASQGGGAASAGAGTGADGPAASARKLGEDAGGDKGPAAGSNPEPHVVIDTTEQEEMPLLRYSYVIQGKKHSRLADKDERTRSHVRQWAALWRCYTNFVRLEKLNGEPYRVFVKMRDDTYFLRPFDTLFNESFYNASAVFKSCASWGGLNDKMAVLDARYAYSFFAAPLMDYYFDSYRRLARGSVLLTSPESYLKAIMVFHNVNIKEVESDWLPSVTSRIRDETGVACVPITPTKVGAEGECLPLDCDLRKHILRTGCTPTNLTEHDQLASLVINNCGAHTGPPP